MSLRSLLVACAVMLAAGAGCSSFFENAGASLTSGAMESVIGRSDSLGRKLDTLITNAGTSAATQAAHIRDTLTGTRTQQGIGALRENLIGAPAQQDVGALRDELIGKKAGDQLVSLRNALLDRSLQKYLSETVAQIGPSLLNDSTRIGLAAARDTLIGPRTNSLVRAIVDSALTALQVRLTRDIYPGMRSNLGFVEQNATLLIVLTGIVALVIAWFIWTQKEKYARIAKMLTVQISAFPEGPAKEAFKTNISQNAKTIGIEDELRKLLDSQGLLHAKDA